MNTRLRRVERVFFLIGFLAVAMYGANLLYSRFYQAYAHWSFDRSLKGKTASAEEFLAYLAQGESPDVPGSLVPAREPGSAAPNEPAAAEETPPNTNEWATQRPHRRQQTLPSGTLPPIGRLQIPAIDLSVIVLAGTDEWTLNRAAGHIEGTALPWELGNTGIAGHRDSFFRGLRKISRNDRILLTTTRGVFQYRVEAVEIVDPTDVQVLKASLHPTLTLVTCYPFYFVGSAPKRFIVKAERLPEQKAPGVTPPQFLSGGVIAI
ncbi:MAG: class D sortase [Acidobacteria bacterium]|nr:class D sortase [Acidobacteriota bacterium]MCI0624716.1 class D sortase [Acidobacteriota bacterium]MCI0717917.1 class D sortase [Acidobacteriota bacterium]